MATINEYLKNRINDNKNIEEQIRLLNERQAISEQDIEANAVAIEELAEIIGGGE